ncbi:MAG: Type 1 glutamine amidotransferase-like domain-containing protein [Candidatus Blackburnbacteria bacterium]|nr:Type 1 glutamine amidotransferase-like domain-containing protein [Candidatus Blackburnbacteria bacterium]
MKLFLASEAKNPKSIKKLEEFVGGFKGKKLAYIPTAANGHGWGSWKDGGSWNLVQKLEMNITPLELEDYWNSDVAPRLRGKDIIWFAGGSCSYLAYWLTRTGLNKKLKGLLEQGSIYVGSSAGSMVTAKNLDVAEWYIGEQEPGAHILAGLGLVDFDIYPHYQEDLYEQIREHYKGNKMFLLKDGEEIIVENTIVKVVGEERVITP